MSEAPAIEPSAIELERDAATALIIKHYDALANIRDTLEDEGDRVYFSSTNDAETLRDIVSDQEGYFWAKELGGPPIDWHGRVKSLTNQAEALAAENARLREALGAVAEFPYQPGEPSWRVAQMAAIAREALTPTPTKEIP